MLSMRLFILVVALATTTLQLRTKKPPFKQTQLMFANTFIAKQHGTRIYGGTPSQDGDFPYMVFLLYAHSETFSTTSSCSASLISVNWVLTAAHCTMGTDVSSGGVFLVAGKAQVRSYMDQRQMTPFWSAVDESALNLQERRSKKVFINPNYNVPAETYSNDVALHLTDKPFLLSSVVSVMPISREKITAKSCSVLGWGLSEGNERSYTLAVASGKIAKSIEDGCKYKSEGPFICLDTSSPKGICGGDSGSPLVCDNKIWGVASHILCDGECVSCGTDEEEFYNDIYSVSQWIQDTTSSEDLKDGRNTGSFNVFNGMILLFAILFNSFLNKFS